MAAFAQTPPVWIELDAKVKPLAYDPDKNLPWIAYTEREYGQYAEFAMIVKTEEGATIVSVEWQDTIDMTTSNINAGQSPFFLWVDESQKHSATATGFAPRPGLWSGRCHVIARLSDNTEFEGIVEVQCVAVGGPLKVELVDKQDLAPKNDLHDKANPWYLQFFGFPPVATNLWPGAQPPQKAKLNTLPQSIQTGAEANPRLEIHWEIEEGANKAKIYFPASPAAIKKSGEIKIGATDKSNTGEVKVIAKFKVIWDGVEYGPFDDDTDESPFHLSTGEAEKINDNYRKFTCHKPKDTFVNGGPWNFLYQFGPTYSWGDEWQMILRDHLEQPMGGVRVQEVFFNEFGAPYPTLNLPVSFIRNTSGNPWITAGLTVTPPGQEEVSGPPEGTFSDFIGISNWYVSVPKNLNPNPVFNFLHSYFAGTSNVSWPRPGEASGGGVFVGQWRMKIWTDDTEHTKVQGGN